VSGEAGLGVLEEEQVGPRKHRNDRHISDETIRAVKRRDQGCIAALWLGADTLCKDSAGNTVSAYTDSAWEFDHVNDFDLGVSHGTLDRVVLLCAFHHRGGWATSNRPLIRFYILGREDGLTPRQAGRFARDECRGIFHKGIDRRQTL
jgi:hypothetical protein